MMKYEEIKVEIKKLLCESRFNHSLEVEKEAIKLGKLYGCDIDKCRIAAIAHDCVKNFKNEELLKLAKEYNIELDYVELNSHQLLHGPIGAEYCKDKFKIWDEDILNAIRFHTTGRGKMSLLEKIIYIADVIEASRDYKGIRKIRKLAYEDLDEAILNSCNNTIQYIIEKKWAIHPLTIEMRNEIIIKNK